MSTKKVHKRNDEKVRIRAKELSNKHTIQKKKIKEEKTYKT